MGPTGPLPGIEAARTPLSRRGHSSGRWDSHNWWQLSVKQGREKLSTGHQMLLTPLPKGCSCRPLIQVVCLEKHTVPLLRCSAPRSCLTGFFLSARALYKCHFYRKSQSKVVPTHQELSISVTNHSPKLNCSFVSLYMDCLPFARISALQVQGLVLPVHHHTPCTFYSDGHIGKCSVNTSWMSAIG